LSSTSRAAVVIEDLRVRYPGRDKLALCGVRESVARGEVIALTGPSGCGKSTLCRTVAGFVPAVVPASVSGTVHVDGLSVLTEDPARVAERLGLVQQDPEAQICTLNVRQEVAFGPQNLCLPRDEVDRRVDEAIAAVGISHLLGRRTTTLSGGEKQRLAIAAILAMTPSTIVLDEPAANLDPDGAKAVFDTLRRLRDNEDRTIVIVEHRLSPLLPLEPRLVIIDRGVVVDRRTSRHHLDLAELGLRAGWGPIRTTSPARPKPKALVMDRVTFSYDDRPVLDRLSLEVRSGEILGIVGPNGGGKTTLLRLAAGLEHPSFGRVTRTRSRVGFVFQHPHQQLFERTVAAELRIDGVLPEDPVRRVLHDASLVGLADAPPLSLSLGEQRRLTLVSALARRPDLLLLDEPFIGQDRKNVLWILSRLRAAQERGAAILLISHDIPLIATIADRLLFLDAESIEGTTAETLARLAATGREAYTPCYWEGLDDLQSG